jgi:hypothetical protein
MIAPFEAIQQRFPGILQTMDKMSTTMTKKGFWPMIDVLDESVGAGGNLRKLFEAIVDYVVQIGKNLAAWWPIIKPIIIALAIWVYMFTRITTLGLRIINYVMSPILKFIGWILMLVIKLLAKLGQFIEKAASLTKGRLFGIARAIIPGLQAGGAVTQGGIFRVGERGPETVYLPAGAAVQPAGAAVMDWSGMPNINVNIQPQHIFMDGREVAEVVWKHRMDRMARK